MHLLETAPVPALKCTFIYKLYTIYNYLQAQGPGELTHVFRSNRNCGALHRYKCISLTCAFQCERQRYITYLNIPYMGKGLVKLYTME